MLQDPQGLVCYRWQCLQKFYSHLEDHLYGQHLVIWVITQSLKAHISKSQPSKALVMSFHGWTGSGKNYASKMIADFLYEKGAQSDFVHWYIGTRDFPHVSEITKYQDRLQKEIPEYTKKCGQSLFIFDEMDKMAPGIIDAIKPYIDFYDEIDGVDYRKNIFIFLSNAGGSEITRVAFNFWLDGKDREDISMTDIEPLVNLGAFNEKGGLQYSQIVEKNLIDVYVPFLPLEKIHVRKCIIHELKLRGLNMNDELINKIASQIIYYPQQFEIFSISGCKKISHKVDVYASDEL
ncbi:torsin-1A [Caerostris darwini]|uniref:Torsin-1A n=1 Tax=Caerostris darwini TaxID=1538125 RepID=A0AAV4WMV7_9ARAC|nr:torsin-1A [Caerostris darwini]